MLPIESFKFINNNDFFAAIIFLSPRSPQWPLVWGLCQGADAISEGKGYYAAAFCFSPESLETLTSICHITQGWKTAHLFIKKKKIAHIYSVRWVGCYLNSLKCTDPMAWCLSVTTAPRRINDFSSLDFSITINTTTNSIVEEKPEKVAVQELFVCPCRELSAHSWGKAEVPISFKGQFQAFAVARGFSECPHFDIEQFKPVYSTVTV